MLLSSNSKLSSLDMDGVHAFLVVLFGKSSKHFEDIHFGPILTMSIFSFWIFFKNVHMWTFFCFYLPGALSSSQDLRKESVIEMRVRPGENITLYCDCKSSVGVYIVWYRNCSHEKQPSLVLKTWLDRNSLDPHSNYESAFFHLLNPFPDFHLVKNNLSQSYNLLITNITETDEGLYYCGTEEPKVKDEEKIIQRYVRTYSNITTKILLHKDSGESCIICALFFSPLKN